MCERASVAPAPSDARQAGQRASFVGAASLKLTKTHVPHGFDLLQAMFNDAWLHVNDSLLGGDDIAEQFINENTQLGLINALLLTMAWSSFYGVMDMDDAWRDVNIETHVWIDLQIVLFGIACMGFGFATVGSVFYLLAANEAGTASKVHSLQAHFGHWLSAPWYFFFTGLFGWGSGFYVQGCVAARTTAAMVVFLVIMLSGTAIFIWSMRECVSGVFTVQRISEDHRPITHTLGHIQAQFRQYAAEVGAENISHDEFRLFLVRPVGHLNYWPGLSAVCQARVDRVFEEELQKAVETSSAAPITLRLAEIRLQFVKYSKQVGSDNIRRAAFTDHLARPAEPGGDVVCLSEVCVARANKVFDEELQKVVDGDDDDSSELSVVTPLMLTPTD